MSNAMRAAVPLSSSNLSIVQSYSAPDTFQTYFRSPTPLSMNRLLLSAAAAAIIFVNSAIAQWTQINHPGYTAVQSITTSPGAIYMVSYPNGVIMSTDNGASWNPANTGLPTTLTQIHSVFYNGTVLLCGTESGIYRSTNGGASWSLANTSLPTASSSNYAKKFIRAGSTTLAVYSATIGGGGGIYRTTDNGDFWFSGNNGLALNMTVYQVAQVGSLLYAATSTGLSSSSNLAVTWSPIASANFTCYAVQGTPARLMVISGLGFRYSNNGGSTWIGSSGAPAAPQAGELILYDGKYWALTGAPDNNVLRSTDNGATFSVYETGLNGPDVISQNTFHASGNTLYLGCIFNLYSHPGTTTGIEQPAAGAMAKPYPTVFTDGFNLDLGRTSQGAQVVLIDAAGREAARHPLVFGPTAWIERGNLPGGTYRVLLAEGLNGQPRWVGTVIAQ